MSPPSAGTAHWSRLRPSYAISMSDFVVIPVQGSQLDAKQAAWQIKLIKAQERIAGRSILTQCCLRGLKVVLPAPSTPSTATMGRVPRAVIWAAKWSRSAVRRDISCLCGLSKIIFPAGQGALRPCSTQTSSSRTFRPTI